MATLKRIEANRCEFIVDTGKANNIRIYGAHQGQKRWGDLHGPYDFVLQTPAENVLLTAQGQQIGSSLVGAGLAVGFECATWVSAMSLVGMGPSAQKSLD